MIDPGKIIVALDIEERKKAQELIASLSPRGVAFKVGLQSYLQWGTVFVEGLVNSGTKVFLDLKFHDIPNTVASAVKSAHGMGIWMVNMHASAGRRAMESAKEVLDGLPAPRPILIGVTVLTSMSAEDLKEINLPEESASWASHLAKVARDSGLDGVVCSAREVARIKEATSPDFLAVTPGIRLPDAEGDDQRRVTTPGDAISAGSDYLVVGRPIVKAADPEAALERILNS